MCRRWNQSPQRGRESTTSSWDRAGFWNPDPQPSASVTTPCTRPVYTWPRISPRQRFHHLSALPSISAQADDQLCWCIEFTHPRSHKRRPWAFMQSVVNAIRCQTIGTLKTLATEKIQSYLYFRERPGLKFCSQSTHMDILTGRSI